MDTNGDGVVSVGELAAALRDMRSFSDDASSSAEELSSVARRLMATAKKGSSLLCSEEETEDNDSLSLEAFLEMMNQVRLIFFFLSLFFSLSFQPTKARAMTKTFPATGSKEKPTLVLLPRAALGLNNSKFQLILRMPFKLFAFSCFCSSGVFFLSKTIFKKTHTTTTPKPTSKKTIAQSGATVTFAPMANEGASCIDSDEDDDDD